MKEVMLDYEQLPEEGREVLEELDGRVSIQALTPDSRYQFLYLIRVWGDVEGLKLKIQGRHNWFASEEHSKGYIPLEGFFHPLLKTCTPEEFAEGHADLIAKARSDWEVLVKGVPLEWEYLGCFYRSVTSD